MPPYDYPHTIESGAGERLTFVRRTTDDDGELLEVTNVVSPGSGPPMHVHHRQTESITVESGELSWERKDGTTGTGMSDVAFLLTRYRTEFGMLAIPAPVQRILFPILLAIGRRTGKFKRCAGAPEPMPPAR